MASVWRGHDQVLGRDVAVKLLHAELAADAKFASGFRAEAVNAANLNHRSIVGVFDIGEHEGVPYLVMELVEGASLREALEDTGPLPPAKAIQIGARVATALTYAHRAGVLHRNVKPTNILLTPGGGVKVSDFSIARPASDEDATRTAELLGSGYLAPEQMSKSVNGGEVDARTDVYALGACLYEMLTGKNPWQAISPQGGLPDPEAPIPAPRSLRPETSPELESLVLTALSREPDRRFQSAQALTRALLQLAAPSDRTVTPPEPAPAPGETTEEDPAPTPTARPGVQWPPRDQEVEAVKRRHPLRLASIGFGVVVLVVLVTLAAANVISPPDSGGGDTPEATTTTSSQPLQARAVEVLDPSGDGENPDLIPQATDGDPSTGWRTESYNSAAFGQLKPGLGLVVQASGQTARTLELQMEHAGGVAEILGGNQLSDSLDGYTPVAAERSMGETASFSLEDSYRYYVVWFTQLPPRGDGRFRAVVNEVELRS